MGKPYANGLLLPHVSPGPTPAAGSLSVYAKSDNRLYRRNSAGVETGMADYAVIPKKAVFDSPESYPFGISMFGVGNASGFLDEGWPTGSAERCMVVTHNGTRDPQTSEDLDWVQQTVTGRTTGRVWRRIATSATVWGAFAELGTGVQPKQPYSKRYRVNNMNVPHSTETALHLGSVIEDYEVSYDGVNSEWTVLKEGLYLFVLSASWERNTTNRRDLRLRVNNSLVAEQIQPSGALDATNNTQVLTYLNRLAVNDIVKPAVWQNSGVQLQIIGGQTITFGALTRLSA